MLCDSGELRSGGGYESLLEKDHCVIAFIIFPSHAFLMETKDLDFLVIQYSLFHVLMDVLVKSMIQ